MKQMTVRVPDEIARRLDHWLIDAQYQQKNGSPVYRQDVMAWLLDTFLDSPGAQKEFLRFLNERDQHSDPD